MSQNQLAKQDAELAIPMEPQIDLAGLFRLAIEKNVSPEAMNQLLTLKERIDATNAKRAFDSARAGFQRRCEPLLKKKQGARPGNNFAPLEQIADEIQLLLDE